jgi:hypothetical protein
MGAGCRAGSVACSRPAARRWIRSTPACTPEKEVKVRLIGKFGLIAATAVIAMASIDASSAFAVDQEVTLCTLNVVLCPGETEIYNAGQAFLLQGKGSRFSAFKEECAEVDIKGKTLVTMNSSLTVDILSMAFTKCTPCVFITVTATNPSKIIMNADGTFTLFTSINVKYDSCIEGTKCAFQSKAVALKVENTKSGLEVFAEEEELKLEEGSPLLCGESTAWSGTFTMSEPSPAFLSLYELK